MAMGTVVQFEQVERVSKHLRTSPPHETDVLSFMRRRKKSEGGGIDYWNVKPTGNYVDDCATGKRLAAEYLAFVGEWPTVGNGTLLGCIVHDMMERSLNGEPWSGVHFGFLGEINHCAMMMAVRFRQAPLVPE